ncbi:MAG TPA: branched-chain amino acid ABC transporter permease [Desulfitobacteriaceae bacterium]|nr:branched-chain amino acid ABC transporter permease [Desulfitobacteriaceae bacterium]
MEQFIANGLCKGSIYALVALGFGLIYTTSGVFHLAHGAVYAVAAYFLYCLLALLHLPFSIAILSSVAIAMALGVLIEIVVYRPLSNRKASGTVMLISSLGVYIVLVNLIALFFGNGSQILRSGAESTIILGNIILTKVQVAQFVVSLFFIIIYWLFLRWSPLGRVCRAVADDAELASVLGVKVEATRLLVIAVGSSLAGVAATLSALDVGIDPFIGFPIVLVAVVACIIGGLHRFISPALGGFLIGLMQSLIVWMTSAQWETAVTFALLIIFLLLRPQGLLGIRQRFEET